MRENNGRMQIGKQSVVAGPQHATFNARRTIDDNETEMIVSLGETALSASTQVSNANRSRSNTEVTFGASQILSGSAHQARWKEINERHRRKDFARQ